MSATKQISAFISEETKAQVETYVKRWGVKKAYLVEEALQHHLQALRDIPEDVVIPARLVLTKEALSQVADLINGDEQATESLKALFRS
jgi:predicted DNA-binding protein